MGPGTACCAQTARATAAACLRCHGIHAAAKGAHGNDALLPGGVRGLSTIASQLNASAILPLTKSGATARNVSKFRPAAPILAITPDRTVACRLQLVWGVTPLVIPQGERTTQTFQAAMVKAKELNLLKEGDLVVQSAGTHTGVSGSTDLVKVSIVGNEAAATLI